jgi:hypothetical protein
MDTKKGSDELTPKQRKAIAALIDNPSTDGAAKAAGVTRQTLWLWMQNEAFRREYHAAQRQLVDGAIAELQNATAQAVRTLVRNLDCGNFFAENGAATTILSHSLKALELRDLIARVDELEKLAKGIKRA